jgi:hypothetical protein
MILGKKTPAIVLTYEIAILIGKLLTSTIEELTEKCRVYNVI